jgi:hypothetical protein
MAHQRVFQTLTGIGVALACVAMLSGVAGAKGAQGATITGPGIRGSLSVGNGSENPAPVNVNSVAVATGTFYAISSSGPSPIQARRPRVNRPGNVGGS